MKAENKIEVLLIKTEYSPYPNFSFSVLWREYIVGNKFSELIPKEIHEHTTDPMEIGFYMEILNYWNIDVV